MTQKNSVDKSVAAAINAVERGWFVFPLLPLTKRPCLPWREASTNNFPIIHRWAKHWPGCNWAVDCEKSGLIVLDVDNKNGKAGTNEISKLEMDRGTLPNTFTVCTPNKGRHHYFTGKNSSRAGFRPGLDLKAGGGYVVLFGSTLPNGEYFIADDVPAVPVPTWLLDAAGRRRPRLDRDPSVDAWMTEPDKPEYIQWAINWLENEAPESIQGKNGDDTLVKTVFFRLRDNGISEDTAVKLVAEHYNEAKAFPPWSEQELVVKAHNAYAYASLPPATETLDIRTAVAAAAFSAAPLPGMAAHSVANIQPASLPARRWIVYHRLLRGYATGLIAPGGVGKSTYTFLDALAIATGRDLTGDRVVESGPVVLYNAEDPLVELQMRFAAVAAYNAVALSDLNGKKHQPVYLVSGRDHKLSVAAFNRVSQSYTTNTADISALSDLLKSTGAILFVGDPFIRLHDVPENDNVAIDKVTEIFTDLADKLQIGVHLVHHTRKLGAAGGEGDQETARGASSFISALRLAHTLSVMSEADAKKYSLSPSERRWYVRLDDAKLNLAPPADKVRWYKRVSVPLENGENIGTLELTKLEVVKKLRVPSSLEDIAAAISLCRLGIDTPIADIVRQMQATNPLELRSARAISEALHRRFKEQRVVHIGNLEAEMVTDRGIASLRITPLDQSQTIERGLLD